jgi:hypothetical protein
LRAESTEIVICPAIKTNLCPFAAVSSASLGRIILQKSRRSDAIKTLRRVRRLRVGELELPGGNFGGGGKRIPVAR